MDRFELDRQLHKDCHLVGDLALSRVLLLDDARYPWVLLVPRVAGVTEIHGLEAAQRHQLIDESCTLGAWMLDYFDGEKLNVGALGNRVAQLHLHHVVRTVDDPAWPGPVWGHSPPVRYAAAPLRDMVSALRGALGLSG